MISRKRTRTQWWWEVRREHIETWWSWCWILFTANWLASVKWHVTSFGQHQRHKYFSFSTLFLRARDTARHNIDNKFTFFLLDEFQTLHIWNMEKKLNSDGIKSSVSIFPVDQWLFRRFVGEFIGYYRSQSWERLLNVSETDSQSTVLMLKKTDALSHITRHGGWTRNLSVHCSKYCVSQIHEIRATLSTHSALIRIM